MRRKKNLNRNARKGTTSKVDTELYYYLSVKKNNLLNYKLIEVLNK